MAQEIVIPSGMGYEVKQALEARAGWNAGLKQYRKAAELMDIAHEIDEGD